MHAATAAQAERFAAYRTLRDAGILSVDAAREIGIGETTRHAYERAYRQACGLPRRQKGGWRGGFQ